MTSSGWGKRRSDKKWSKFRRKWMITWVRRGRGSAEIGRPEL